MDIDPDVDKPGGTKTLGDCEVEGVTTIGVSVIEADPGVVDDVLVNIGTGGKVDKLKRGAGALKRLCIEWVCAA